MSRYRLESIYLLVSKFLLNSIFTFLNSTKAYASEICNSLNSININTNQNLINIQKYLQNYFPQLKISGGNDSQNKFYISKYQYAFGLKNTGILNEETLKFLRKENNCFELENNILKNRIIRHEKLFPHNSCYY